jgi:HK97 family phage portal protein
MGFLHSLDTVAPVAPMRAGTPPAQSPFWYRDPHTGFAIGAHGVSSDLALTLSYLYGGVSIIVDDFGSQPCQTFERLPGGGRRDVGYDEPGVGRLAYLLHWQPNAWQTATAFWRTLAWQYQLRRAAYAEVLYRPDQPSVIDQIIPRHPDRVEEEHLENGRVRYKLLAPGQPARYVSQDEMLCVRNTSMDGLAGLSRVEYGRQAISSGLSLQSFTYNYFRGGVAAAVMATYKGTELSDEQEAALHRSMMRYMGGVENAGGLLLVPADIDVKTIGVEPEKAQLLGLKNYSGRDVARLLKMPPSWLGIEGAAAYSSYVQDAQVYKDRVQIPLAVEFEQAVQRDLVIASRYFMKFNMDYSGRSDFKSRMEGYEVGIRARVLRPSECRLKEDLNPDERLDQLSEQDHRPASPSKGGGAGGGTASSRRARAIALAAADRVVRRETAAIAKAAQKYAKDRDGFARWSEQFYGEQHVDFVAGAMAMSFGEAARYCDEQRTRLATGGLVAVDNWAQQVPSWLAERALTVDEAA